ncbi:MAG: hypothetical protein ACD_36C00006G0001 [uncultured bacterium]|uniref:Beta-lactamase class A catalytic domain-containing protein n=1 Tax=Candidatus Gottesmanbacteria bacterium RIFCSPLOWO2_01_FULL_43_11b TaxID=1798392 RepID=A0A1F6AI38_9BACT|nr:MAG: hypothetical protein ACD_36C00006G0001 [uncultured bacterium]OGG24365.1 MAG: hypothetical protein A3A79_04235 [Candidatus Gottesmanbacteria bacterium RIFCSPLOWO2_01_FULL_43_11b]
MEYYARSLPQRNFSRVVRLLVVLILLGIGIYTLLFSFRPQPVISPIPDEKPPQTQFGGLFAKKKTPEELGKILTKEINDTWKNYSLYVKDYNSDFELGINEEVIYTAASVNKIPILSALYYYTQAGEIDLDESITLQEADIQDFGTGVLRYETPGATYTIKTLARLMIQKSDNTAAYILLNNIVRIERTQKLMESWGLIQTDIANNKTSNKDISMLFEKIISGDVANQAYTQEMLSFLKDTDFEDRLPAMLPKSVTVYHKIGTGVRIIHDVGYVTDGNLNYYVGIFTSDVPSEDDAVLLMAKLSKSIYNFMR